MIDWLWLLAAFVLTLAIYSYVVKDNALYRLAVHMLVGISAAYTAVVVTSAVIQPALSQIAGNPASLEALLWLPPILLAFLLLLKAVPQLAVLGNSGLAALVGVGAAVALVGAVLGTLVPQVAAVTYDNGLLGVSAALLTILALSAFFFTGRVAADGRVVQPAVQRYLALGGRVILTITFGALFAGLLGTTVAILAERVSYFVNGFAELLNILP